MVVFSALAALAVELMQQNFDLVSQCSVARSEFRDLRFEIDNASTNLAQFFVVVRAGHRC
jgi:hypothetical protein